MIKSLLVVLLSVSTFSIGWAQFGGNHFGTAPYSDNGEFGTGAFGEGTGTGNSLTIPNNALTFNGAYMQFNGKYMTFTHS